MIDIRKYMRRTKNIAPWAHAPGYMRYVGLGGPEERLRIEERFEVQRVSFQALIHPDHNNYLYVYFLKKKEEKKSDKHSKSVGRKNREKH